MLDPLLCFKIGIFATLHFSFCSTTLSLNFFVFTNSIYTFLCCRQFTKTQECTYHWNHLGKTIQTVFCVVFVVAGELHVAVLFSFLDPIPPVFRSMNLWGWSFGMMDGKNLWICACTINIFWLVQSALRWFGDYSPESIFWAAMFFCCRFGGGKRPRWIFVSRSVVCGIGLCGYLRINMCCRHNIRKK